MSKNKQDEYWMPDDEDLEQLQRDLQASFEHDVQKATLPTRSSIKRRFANLDPDTMAEIQDALEDLEEYLGINTLDLKYLSGDEVDLLLDELLAVRQMNDILSAREDTLKTFARDVISKAQLDPDKTPGDLISAKHNLKISKEIRGGKPSIDIDLLKKRLTGEQFSRVTNRVVTTVETTMPDGKMDETITTTYTINEKFLEKEMLDGNILSEDVFLSTVESKRTIAMYIRDLNGPQEVS